MVMDDGKKEVGFLDGFADGHPLPLDDENCNHLGFLATDNRIYLFSLCILHHLVTFCCNTAYSNLRNFRRSFFPWKSRFFPQTLVKYPPGFFCYCFSI